MNPRCPSLHRRHFILTALAASVTGTAAAPAKGAIDFHHHAYPPAFRQALTAAGRPTGGGADSWSLENSLAMMDSAAIETAMLSIPSPGVWLGEAAAARALARRCNEDIAAYISARSGRFGGFACLPLPDVEGTLAEIAYGLDTLHLDGVSLLTSYGAQWLGDPAFAPVLSELDRRGALVFVHPVIPACCGTLAPYIPAASIEMPAELARGIASLFYGGALAKLASIRFVFAQGGGAIATLAPRVDDLARRRGPAPEHGFAQLLARHHFDISSMTEPTVLRTLLAVVGPSQLLFGSDYPANPPKPTLDGLRAAGLNQAQLSSILRDEAARLVPRLAR